MSWWRDRPLASRRVLAFGALLGAVSVTGSMAAAPAFAAAPPRQSEWHVNAMRLPDAWKISRGQGVTVAVIDGGVSADRPDLAGQVLAGHDFSAGVKSSTLDAQLSHGTAMASLIAGTGKGVDGQGAVGVAPGAKILPLRVLSTDVGTELTNDQQFDGLLAKAIRYAADSSARVINISQGTMVDTAGLRSAVDYARSKNKLVFAAVGNEAAKGNPVEYPAAIPGVVGVAALDETGKTTSESEHGPQVSLAGPGKDMIEACTAASGYCVSHGTSDATAVVSGVAALIWAKHPSWTADQVLRVMINTAEGPTGGVKRDQSVGYGLVRPRVALETPGDPGPADVDPLFPASATASASAPANTPSQTPSSASVAEKGSDLPWIVGGVVVLLVVAGGGVAFARRGR
jgi:type VII secretion-associated serine protease mycosin